MIPTVQNVIDVYRRATPEQYRAGMDWYVQTHNFARSLDSNVSRAAGIIAAYSPRQPWELNKIRAIETYNKGYAHGHTKVVCAKVQAIWEGGDPLVILGGKKTTNFYLNILDPYSNSGVTIDRHAFDIAVGEITDDKARGILSRKGVYESFAAVYVAAAGLFNIPAPAMQAITWERWRMEKGIK